MLRYSYCALLALFCLLVLSPTITSRSDAIALAVNAAGEQAGGAGVDGMADEDELADDMLDEEEEDDDDLDDDEAEDDDDDDIDVDDEDDDDDDAPEDDDDEDDDDEDDDADDDASAGGDDAEAEADKPAVIDPPGSEGASYTAPSTAGALFADSFQDGLSKWTHTSVADYAGKFVVGQGAKPTFAGDRALIIPEKARKYGLSASIPGLGDLSAKTLVVQYEVKLDQGMTCGGAYVKLPLTDFKVEELDGSTPYSVMFGPDKCGSTDKVHFIFQSRNPVTGKMSEHHLKTPPSVANSYDKKTHLYTLIVKDDSKFEVHVDGEKKSDGKLSDSFEPPVQPAEEIDDPEDKKPSDWVDTKKISDPEAKKPDDWDEDAPAQIPDEDAVKPEGWLDDEPEKVPDPDAKKPDGWDDDEDGEWEAPLVANPKCEEIGCGEWKRPLKANPAYKGKWTAPKIDNPDYIGEWKPKKIANPDFYEVDKVHLLGIGGIGFEIWTMDQGVLFDNVWVGSDIEKASEFANATFRVKQKTELVREEKEREDKKTKKSEKKSEKKAATSEKSLGPVIDRVEDVIEKVERALAPVEAYLAKIGMEPYLEKLIDMGIQKPMLVVVSIPIMLVLIILILLSGGKKERAPGPASATTGERSAATSAVESKKTDAVTEDDGEEEEEEKEEAAKEEDKAEGITGAGLRKRAKATAE